MSVKVSLRDLNSGTHELVEVDCDELATVRYLFNEVSSLELIKQKNINAYYIILAGKKIDLKNYGDIQLFSLGYDFKDGDIPVIFISIQRILIVGACIDDKSDIERFKELSTTSQLTFASNCSVETPSKVGISQLFIDFNNLSSFEIVNTFNIIFIDKYTLKFIQKTHVPLFRLLFNMLAAPGHLFVMETSNYGSIPVLQGSPYKFPNDDNYVQPRTLNLLIEVDGVHYQANNDLLDLYNDSSKNITTKFLNKIGFMSENISFKGKEVPPPYGGVEIKRFPYEGLSTDKIGDVLQCYWFVAIKNREFRPTATPATPAFTPHIHNSKGNQIGGGLSGGLHGGDGGLKGSGGGLHGSGGLKGSGGGLHDSGGLKGSSSRDKTKKKEENDD